jgi:hypothetical protein
MNANTEQIISRGDAETRSAGARPQRIGRTCVYWFLALTGVWLAGFALSGVVPAAGIVAAIALIALAVMVYFVPTLVAIHEEHRNAAAIGVLNLLLGWTVLGWIVALVWAVKR